MDYLLRNDGKAELVLPPAELSAKVEGWVSNSKVAGHATPRRASVTVAGSSASATMTGHADVIESSDETKRCRERATLLVWLGDMDQVPAAPQQPKSRKTDESDTGPPKPPPSLRIAPGATVRVRLFLEHEHVLYGPHDPLLGQHDLELRLGAAQIHDRLPLDQPRRVPRHGPSWPSVPPPAERLDQRIYLSAPDSLHLEAHVPEGRSYRFPDLPIRYGTKMRLRFWYLVAPGTAGQARARIVQYKDLPSSWKTLPDGELEHPLTTVGRWVRVERVFRTEPEATTLSLDFRILSSETDIGEVWIDDASIEPLGNEDELEP